MNELLFGKRLKELRLASFYTLEKLAEKTNISRTSLHYYETGKKIPLLSTAIELAQFFNVTLDYISGLDYTNSK